MNLPKFPVFREQARVREVDVAPQDLCFSVGEAIRTARTWAIVPLRGEWWVAIYYAWVLVFGNIVGEELWWRGYLLPRQEAASGAVAWLYHGILWAAFHLFLQPTAWDMIRMMPTCCALAFVAQYRKNTWPGIIAHTVGNSGILIGIVHGIAG